MKRTRDTFAYVSPQPPLDKFAQCETCSQWDGERKRCAILGPDFEVPADASCDYYLHGQPHSHDLRAVMTPEEAGFVVRQVRCGNCVSLDGTTCRLFEKLNSEMPELFDLNVAVNPAGCCNAQVPKETELERKKPMTVAATAQRDQTGVPEAEKFPKADQGESPDKSRHIVQEGDKWVLYDSEGKKKLGEHDTKEEAEKQEEAIKANEAKEGGGRNRRGGAGERRESFRSTKVSIETRMVKRDDGTEEPKKVIVGYAARYHDSADDGTEFWLYDDVVERIAPGAFDDVVANAGKPGGPDTLALFNHNADHILGRAAAGTLRLSLDEKGLRFEIDPPNTHIAEAVVEGVRRGDIPGCSFAFDVDKDGQTWTDVREGDDRYMIRTLKRFSDLMDVSVCSRPAYGGTSVGMRSDFLSDETKATVEKMRMKRLEEEHGDVERRLKIAEMS